MAVQQNNVRKEEAKIERREQRNNTELDARGVQGDPMPMDDVELQQADAVVQQLWRLVANAQQDVRFDEDVQ
jgi:hypothetical protein